MADGSKGYWGKPSRESNNLFAVMERARKAITDAANHAPWNYTPRAWYAAICDTEGMTEISVYN